jgi:hypothetical protein
MWHESVEDIGPEKFREDLTMAKETLEDVIGQSVDCYRAPSFSITPSSHWAFEILMESGFQTDASISNAMRFHGGGFNEFPCDSPFTLSVQGEFMRCFPLSSWRFLGKNLVVTGGGYLRIAPSALIRRIIKRHEYVMTYLHPSDFDLERPALEGDRLQDRLRRRVRIGDLQEKVRMMHLLTQSGSISQHAAKLDWSSLPVFNL